MNRIFLNTKKVEKSLYGKHLKNTVIIVNKLRNFKILNMYIQADKETEYLIEKKKMAIVHIKNSKNGLISGVRLKGSYRGGSIYNRMFKKNKK